MQKFEVGDRVECENEFGLLQTGKITKIDALDMILMYEVSPDDRPDDTYLYFNYELKLV